jgi:phage minor structural protein
MAGAVPTLFWFDRFDERIGMLPVAGELVHAEELGGEDVIEFATRETPAKGDRLLWRAGGVWREHVVVRTVESLEGLCSVYAESSLCELLDDFIEEEHIVGKSAAEALACVLAPTRWEVGACDAGATASCMLYHANALYALRRVAEVWGGELTAEVLVANGRVNRRVVRLDARRGAWRGVRFVYGKNMAGCTKTVLEQDVYTALYGFGAGLPVTDESGRYTGGYRKKLTFGEVNGGVNWVGDEDARLVWGRWNADRTEKVHSFGSVVFNDCDDPAKLLALTRKALAEAVRPKVSYEVDVAALDGGEVELGDTVAVIDSSRAPEWRLKARVVKRVRRFGDVVLCRVTIGSVQAADYAAVSTLAADVAALQDDVAGIDGNLSVATSAAYVADTVSETVSAAIDELDELAEVSF